MSLQQTAIANFRHCFSSKVLGVPEVPNKDPRENPYFFWPVTKPENRKKREENTNKQKNTTKDASSLKKSLLIQSTGGILQSLYKLLTEVPGFPKLAFNPMSKTFTWNMPGTNYLFSSAQISFFIANTCSQARSTCINKPGSGHHSFILLTERMLLGKIWAPG